MSRVSAPGAGTIENHDRSKLPLIFRPTREAGTTNLICMLPALESAVASLFPLNETHSSLTSSRLNSTSV